MIKIKAREVHILKAHVNPKFIGKTVYTNSIFNSVELWLRQKGKKYNEALTYWLQAKAFYEASENLPITAKPLTAYYCCMNASKALLACHEVPLLNISHGVASARNQQTPLFKNNKIFLLTTGVYGKLSQVLNEGQGNKTSYKIYDLLYNIPCVHRAFILSFSEAIDLFVPIHNCGFEIDNHKRISYIFKISKKYLQGNAKSYIPSCFELIPDGYNKDSNMYCYYRTKRKNYKWDIHQPQSIRLNNLEVYYRKIRPNFYCIDRGELVWYIKKQLPHTQTINKSPLLLIYAVMHWMSELVRYNPQLFNKFMLSKPNWLINEFVNVGLSQFIDGISSEITGANMCLIK